MYGQSLSIGGLEGGMLIIKPIRVSSIRSITHETNVQKFLDKSLKEFKVLVNWEMKNVELKVVPSETKAISEVLEKTSTEANRRWASSEDKDERGFVNGIPSCDCR